MSNGKKFEGNYCMTTKKLSGLDAVFDMAGEHVLNLVHMLLFAFDGKSIFKVSAFDENLYEIISPGTPLSVGICVLF